MQTEREVDGWADNCTFQTVFKIVNQFLAQYVNIFFFILEFSYICKFAVMILLNPLNAELNPICHLLALLEAHHILHISRIRVNTRR